MWKGLLRNRTNPGQCTWAVLGWVCSRRRSDKCGGLASFLQVESFVERFPSVTAVREGEEMDAPGDAAGSSQQKKKKGPGRPPLTDKRQPIRALVAAYLQRNRTPGFNQAELGTYSMWVYSYADVRGWEIVTSAAYTRSRSRDSSFVQVRFGDPPLLYPGVVQYYVRVVKQAAAPLVLRLAVCRFYTADPARPHVCDADLGLCLRALEGVWADDPEGLPVALDSIDHKLNRGLKPAPHGSGVLFPSHVISKGRVH